MRPQLLGVPHRFLRHFATRSQAVVFDRGLKRRQRDWAASQPDAHEYDYLREEVARRLVDRMEDIQQRAFPRLLDVGCHGGHVYKAVVAQEALGEGGGGIGGVKVVVQGDCSEAACRRAMAAAADHPHRHRAEAHTIMMDEEHFPFPDSSFDIVTSSLSLHWVNDLPRALSEVRRVLKPDGVFLGAMLGGNTLTELREAMLIGEMEREGGVSPHVSPMASASDAGGLLSGAGFSLPTVDVDSVTCAYGDAFTLMADLQGMGEANASVERRAAAGGGARPLSRDSLLAAAAAYHVAAALQDADEVAAGEEEEEEESPPQRNEGEAAARTEAECLLPPCPVLTDVHVRATFQVVYMIGWAPHVSQQAADKRGAAKRSLAEISVTTTTPATPGP